MLKLAGQNLLLGGFHDHWLRNGADNPALLLAALDYYHLDFMCLMDGLTESAVRLKAAAEAYCPAKRLFLGHEKAFGWGHVVTVGGEPGTIDPPADEPDFRQVLRRLRELYPFVTLAHPDFPVTRERILLAGALDDLLDGGCVDAVQICFGPEEMAWVKQRTAAGGRLPLVQGWDHHNLCACPDLSAVLYQDRAPAGHIDTAAAHRTIVFAERNEQAEVLAAVKQGRCVLDDGQGGLWGARELVEFLQVNGYHQALHQLDARRDRRQLRVTSAAVMGRPLSLEFGQAGRVRLPGTLEAPQELPTDPAGRLTLDRLPFIQARDETHVPIVFSAAAGGERAWAVSARHPLRLDMQPTYIDGRPGVEVARAAGTSPAEYRLLLPQLTAEELRFPAGADRLILPVEPPTGRAVDYTLLAMSEEAQREFSGYLTYVRAPRGAAAVEPIRIDAAEFVGGYGANRPYPGPEVFSAELAFSWTDAEFRLEARVADPVHHQPRADRMIYQADCLQLALDPLYRRDELMGSVYVFNLALTPRGPLVWRYASPTREAGADFVPPPEESEVSGDYLRVEPWAKGLIYRLALPWRELAPARPQLGGRLGVYFIMFNNNGEGLLDALQWPRPLPGMWMRPKRWGTIVLTE